VRLCLPAVIARAIVFDADGDSHRVRPRP
jgi:hypothetical protein